MGESVNPSAGVVEACDVSDIGPSSLSAFGWVFAARLISSGLAFVGSVLLARKLQPALYGQYGILVNLMHIVIGFTGSALDTSLVRFAAGYISRDRDGTIPYFQAALRLKVLIAAGIVVVAAVGAKPLAGLFLGDHDGSGVFLVAIALVGGALVTFLGFAQAYFQAHQKFRQYACFELATVALRWTCIILLLVVGCRSLGLVMVAYVAAPAIMAVAAWSFLPRGLATRENEAGPIVAELLHFAKWVVLASVFTVLAQRIDLLFLGAFGIRKESVGHYGAAVQLVLLGDIVILTLFNVLLPKTSRIRHPVAMRAFLQRLQVPMLVATAGMTPLLFLSGIAVRAAFGPAFDDAGGLFAVLLSGTLVALFTAPAGAAVYGLGRSHLIASLEGGKLFITAVGGLVAVPFFGVFGMAWTVTLAKGTIGALTYVVALREARRGEPGPVENDDGPMLRGQVS